ncbi:hypothetical protein GS429_13135 [Natronorubrum sp. JWXQ-INN-674]|uniref:Zn-ribbon containing protein n=1 Tax=Natronorubrum halalkaliphilum TaxID=2691917 RepID=A0A6B0VP23_9EURY|nr:Zn-ribbon containing protein [Natronorubrum halalkaliphilum]MXV62995.1 hypothetical protein [Natronorubrum halalkaliphilum]
MPHECTNCGRTFPDGSKEMLSGCPDCGGNKFQFAPSGRVSTDSNADDTSSRSTESPADTASDPVDEPGSEPELNRDPASAGPEPGDPDSSGTVERAAETVRGWVSSKSDQTETSPQIDGAGTERETSTTPSDLDPDDPTESDRPAGGSDGSTDANPTAESDRSWPSSDDRSESAEPIETEAFTEWPDTARRPEDRSTAPDSDTRPDTAGREQATVGTGSESQSESESKSESESESIVGHSTLEDSEDTAQADARSEVISTDDLPGTEPGSSRNGDRAHAGDTTGTDSPAPADGDDERPPDHDGRVVSEPSGENPSIEELRAELNEQFESIKIVNPGQYELNLMELYNREEYIISLQEDGRYVIDVPDSWRDDE